MLPSRRRFLKTGVLSAFSAGLALTAARAGLAQTPTQGGTRAPIESAAALPAEVQRDPVFSFKAQTFQPYVGDIFTAPNARGERVPLELSSVKTFTALNASRYTRRSRVTDSFTLVFKAASELPPFTSIHKINHPALGDFYLFLTPRKLESGDRLYEAVINHIP